MAGIMDALGVRMDTVCRLVAPSGRLSVAASTPGQVKEPDRGRGCRLLPDSSASRQPQAEETVRRQYEYSHEMAAASDRGPRTGAPA